jgi:pheromone shutdown protein TraB
MPRYLVTTRRALRDSAPSALAAVEKEHGVDVVNGENPDMVTVEASEERAASLTDKLKETHNVEPEIRRSLH